ncbi:hypothetical protein RRG08_039722 [Elysia crispata]|uniref:IgGFc-binding protein N-terminal domain-containing protein n=1 Tax=Elysia crispata TaxID=231223 RepID=A0AAE0YAV4_9GAST|nr:hypothetical protein RRG08_039722 [Elysia crispata]
MDSLTNYRFNTDTSTFREWLQPNAGDGYFRQHVKITCPEPIGVQVAGTQDTDGFVVLPVESWDTSYWPVTYWIEFGGHSVLALIAYETTTVTITIPTQDSNHLTIFDTLAPAKGETVTVNLEEGEVYQLKRNFDISGCQLTSTVRFGVVSGTDFTWIGDGSTQGAIYDWVPGRSTLGTDFVVPMTPGRGSIGDLVQVMAIYDETHVIISTDFRRLMLDSGKSVIRLFDEDLIQVQSDRPIVVVKFSQSAGNQGIVGHPTMTYIPPTDQYLEDTVFIVPEIMGFISMTQQLVIVGTSSAVLCATDSLQVATPQSSLYGTNMAVQTFTMQPGIGQAEFQCPTSGSRLAVYHYFTSDEFSFQVAVAHSQANINPECQATSGTPGDNVDNDCDGQIDEDPCTDPSATGPSIDCEPVFIGNVDIFGKSFTFLVPEHCSESDVISLLITSEIQAEIALTVKSPLVTTLINKATTKPVATHSTEISLPASGLKAASSEIYNTTLVITADAEISATLLMKCPGAADTSAVAARLIPNEALGVEYFAITMCMKGNCHIQISAPHAGTTTVRIRLRLTGVTSMWFLDQNYASGELICVRLDQFQSAQLTVLKGDLTGTHILSDKPVSVMSGGQLTDFMNGMFKDGLLEMLPPVSAWGIDHLVVQTPKMDSIGFCDSSSCRDYIKLVVSENNVNVKLIYGTGTTSEHILYHAGDSILLELPDNIVRVQATEAVLMFQITQEILFGLEVSASLVLPPSQWHRGDFLPVAQEPGMEFFVLLVSNQMNIELDSVLLDNSPTSMTDLTALNISYHRALYSVTEPVVELEFDASVKVGGQFHAVGLSMGTFYPLAFKLDTINDACAVTRGYRGDMVDNDCDGRIDEESCVLGNLADDEDGDGMLNEDCAQSEGS